MIPIRPRIGRLLLVAAAVAVAGTGQRASAQDDDEPEERMAPDPREQRLQKLAEQLQHLSEREAHKAQVDRWVAIQIGSTGRFQDQLEKRLASRLDELKAVCRVTEAQANKLELAGRGDIKRTMDWLDQIVRRLEDSQGDAREFRIATTEIQAARNAASFGKDSLFSKTLARTLSAEQMVDREKVLIERIKRRYPAAVSTAVAKLQRNLGLEERQRALLADLLVKETRPPRSFGDASDIAIVLFQASRIPTQRLKPIFDEAQWRTMSQWIAAYKEGEGGAELLKRHGFVYDDDPAIRRFTAAEPARKFDRPPLRREQR